MEVSDWTGGCEDPAVVRMGAYTTNEYGFLHGHQVVLTRGNARFGDDKYFELCDGTFQDNCLHRGVEYKFDYTIQTARTVAQEYLWSESDIAQHILARGHSLDDEIHRGLIEINVGVWTCGTPANDCYYKCFAPNEDLFQPLHDHGPFQHTLYRFHDESLTICGPRDVHESIWRLQ